MPGLRLLRRTRLVSRFTQAHYRAQAVEQVWKYVFLELTGGKTARYTPRGNAVDVYVRHGTSDGNILQEVNLFGLYDPPADIDADLRSIESLQVLDLGAHIGLFGARMLSLYPNAFVVAFEPDPLNFEALGAAATGSERWQPIQAAAWTDDTRIGFASGGFAESRYDPGASETVPAVDVFPYLENADLVKIDIEGSEWVLLADPRFINIAARAVILEWHPQGCGAGDPHAEAVRALQAAGFSVREIPGASPGVGMLWGYRNATQPRPPGPVSSTIESPPPD